MSYVTILYRHCTVKISIQYIDRQQCWGDWLLYCITYGNLSRWSCAPCVSLPERRT